MVSKRQRVVNIPDPDVDAAVASFVADVIELGGLFRRLADDIAGSEGQTQSRWYALSVFSAEPLTVAHGARRLGVTRQALQRSANDLISRELARFEPNPDHRASPFVVLSSRGRQLLARITDAAAAARRDWFADQDAAALDAAHAEIRRLRDALRGVVHDSGTASS